MNWRVPLGFILAPVIPSGAFYLYYFYEPNPYPEYDHSGIYWFILIVSQIIGLVIGWPLCHKLRQQNVKLTLVKCVIFAALISICITLAISGGGGSSTYSSSDAGGPLVIDNSYTLHGLAMLSQIVGFMAIFGGGMGFFFWLVVGNNLPPKPIEAENIQEYK